MTIWVRLNGRPTEMSLSALKPPLSGDCEHGDTAWYEPFMQSTATAVAYRAARPVRLLAQPTVVLIGNVFTDMTRLVRRAAEELSDPGLVSRAASVVPTSHAAMRDATLLQEVQLPSERVVAAGERRRTRRLPPGGGQGAHRQAISRVIRTSCAPISSGLRASTGSTTTCSPSGIPRSPSSASQTRSQPPAGSPCAVAATRPGLPSKAASRGGIPWRGASWRRWSCS